MSVDESLNNYAMGLHKEVMVGGEKENNPSYEIFHAEKDSLYEYYYEYNANLNPCSLENIKPHYDATDIRSKLYNLYNRQRRYMQDVWESVAKKDGTLLMCPICGMKPVRDWDHYIPRSVMPEYSIHLQNLIPTCGECNGQKHNGWLEKGKRMFFNAYYDKAVDLKDVLQVNVSIKEDLPAVTIKLRTPVDGEEENVRITISTIEKLDLIRLYWQEKANEVMRAWVRQFVGRVKVTRQRQNKNCSIADMWDMEKDVVKECLKNDNSIHWIERLVDEAILSSADMEKWCLLLCT